jgi:two-component system chemotaxis response regulator CheY
MKSKSKILAVDDSLVMQRILSDAIESLGFEPLCASNGEDALEVIRHHADELALVLLDWNMPVMDGLTTLQAMQKSERFSRIPVMMVTTECEKQRVVEAIKAGAKHYLTKPFSNQDLAVRIMECLGQGLARNYA